MARRGVRLPSRHDLGIPFEFEGKTARWLSEKLFGKGVIPNRGGFAAEMGPRRRGVPTYFHEVLPHQSARQRARSPQVGMARRLCIPETALPRLRLGTPTTRRPYLYFTRCCRTHPRGSATVPPKVGMARRHRPTCAATPPLHPETALLQTTFERVAIPLRRMCRRPARLQKAQRLSRVAVGVAHHGQKGWQGGVVFF